MKYHRLICLFAIILFFACKKTKDEPEEVVEEKQMSVGTFSDPWTCSILKGSNSNFDIAEFTLWLPNPADVSGLKAILVLANHSNSNGLGLVYAKEWQDFAKQNNVALMALHLENLNPRLDLFDLYFEAEKGSGQALLMALEAITNRNSIPSVNALPLLFRGYSAGGIYGYNFSAFKPDRVIAFSNIRGWALHDTPADNIGVPGLFLIAELDTEKYENIVPRELMEHSVLAKRKQHALYSYAIEPNEDHSGDVRKSDSLSRVFFAAALKQRIKSGSNTLLSISEESGWLGNNALLTVSSYDTYSTTKNEASWLINEEVANKWISYQQ
ncbi:MAG TPA: hypothetical protein VFF27_16785 [Bacteroidia bacterium]|jgi:hypothetical protein|nr:hypothetical protein [Bacteroidia bacterium]